MSCYSQDFDDRDDLDRERFSENIDQQGFSEKFLRPQGHAVDCRCSGCGYNPCACDENKHDPERPI